MTDRQATVVQVLVAAALLWFCVEPLPWLSGWQAVVYPLFGSCFLGGLSYAYGRSRPHFRQSLSMKRLIWQSLGVAAVGAVAGWFFADSYGTHTEGERWAGRWGDRELIDEGRVVVDFVPALAQRVLAGLRVFAIVVVPYALGTWRALRAMPSWPCEGLRAMMRLAESEDASGGSWSENELARAFAADRSERVGRALPDMSEEQRVAAIDGWILRIWEKWLGIPGHVWADHNAWLDASAEAARSVAAMEQDAARRDLVWDVGAYLLLWFERPHLPRSG